MHKAASLLLFEEHSRSLTERLCNARKWVLHKCEFPLIDCVFTKEGKKSLRLRLHCDEWNSLPASIELLDAHGEPLHPDSVPIGKTSVFNKSMHPQMGKPFICMKGSREYHTHPSHIADLWEPLRADCSYHLDNLLTQLWHAWLKEVR